MSSLLKKFSVLAAAIFISFPIQLYVGSGAYTEFHDPDAPRLSDDADVLSEAEEASLLERMTVVR